MTKDEALRMALDELANARDHIYLLPENAQALTEKEMLDSLDKTIAACREALAQPEQEPMGYWQGQFSKDGGATLYEVPQVSIFGRTYPNIPLYSTPPQRKPLTDEEIEKIWWETKPYFDKHDFTRAIEAAHGIKENT